MFAIHVDPQTLQLSWGPAGDPVMGDGDVLIDVRAAGVNRADLLQRSGRYPPPPGASAILGLEVAGRIERCGPLVRGFATGDRVCALLPGGGYSTRVSVHYSNLVKLPEIWSYFEGAAYPEAFATAFVNLFMEAGMHSGDRVLIHGGASGVGCAAIQLAAASGAFVVATAHGLQKQSFCKTLGATTVVDHHDYDFAAAILETVGSMDIILDIAGAAYMERNLRLLAQGGRLVIISLLGGANAGVDLSLLMRKRGRIIGSTLRSRSIEEKAAILHNLNNRFGAMFMNGTIRNVIDRVIPVERADEAHETLKINKNLGKVILHVSDDPV